MTANATQLVVIAFVASALAAFVIHAARKQRLSFRYTVGWLGLLAISILAGVLIPVVGPIAEALSMSGAAVLVGVSVSILLGVSIQLSISISGLQRVVERQNETIAILQAKVDQK
jgi:hypothetical protein